MSFSEIAKDLDIDEETLFEVILTYGVPDIIADNNHKILEKIPMSPEVWEMIAKSLVSVMILDMQYKPEGIKTYNK